MDEDRILRTLVGSFNPEDATGLPLSEQRQIIREITGYRVTDPIVALAFLQDIRLRVLVDDAGVAAEMRVKLGEEGYTLASDDDLRDYVDAKNAAVLARDEDNWTELDERFGREVFRELLLHAGNARARQYYEYVIGRELTQEEREEMFLAALRARDYEGLQQMVEYEQGNFLSEIEIPEARARILALSDNDIRNLTTYEQLYHSDITAFIPMVYYMMKAVAPFLTLMRDRSERDRSAIMNNLPRFLPDRAFDLDNIVVQAYLANFPEDEAARELAYI